MTQSTKIDDILEFAMDREQEAVEFYTDLAGKAQSAAMKDVFEQFAGEERGHKARLAGIKAGKRMISKSGRPVLDLSLADYLVADEPRGDLSYQDVLILAMKKEKAAFRLYSDLAAHAEDGEMREVLLDLAQQEARHKLRFEIEYDEHVLTEN